MIWRVSRGRVCRGLALSISLICCLRYAKSLSLSCDTSSFLGQDVQPFHRSSHHVGGITLTMKIKVGILGLPNVGKSTLFNALSQRSLAHAANFPFCTIDPNVAPIPVPDPYLSSLGELSSSSVTKPAVIEWIDVAGLAKGAHRGEGLGNRFLATLRECDALCHLVRTFPDPNVVHVDGKVEPVSDAESINLELLYADLAHVQRRLEKKTCVDIEQKTLMHILIGLEKGIPARSQSLSNEQLQSIKSMGLLTLKPVLYTFNVDEVDFCYRKQAMEDARVTMESIQYCDPNIDKYTIVSAKIEAELGLKDSKEEKMEYLARELDIDFDCDDEREKMEKRLCYNILPSMVMKLLKINVVYTGPGVPPERSRTTKAYLLSQPRQRQSITAIQFAGRLHGDIQKGFLNAEIISAKDLMLHSNYVAAKQAGFVRTEGADYILTANDVVLIKWK